MAYVKTTYTWTNRRSPPSRLQHGENFKQEKELGKQENYKQQNKHHTLHRKENLQKLPVNDNKVIKQLGNSKGTPSPPPPHPHK